MSMNRLEVWKLKEHVCTACGAELEKDGFRIYHRREDGDDVEPEDVDLVCPDCYEELDTEAARGETEFILEEIEEEMPDAPREEKTLEYLRRASE